MIRSLRRKFIAMTMAVFLAMLCVIFWSRKEMQVMSANDLCVNRSEFL